jgi:hypothetical protein
MNVQSRQPGKWPAEVKPANLVSLQSEILLSATENRPTAAATPVKNPA